jgi:hypothetical protein
VALLILPLCAAVLNVPPIPPATRLCRGELGRENSPAKFAGVASWLLLVAVKRGF